MIHPCFCVVFRFLVFTIRAAVIHERTEMNRKRMIVFCETASETYEK